jgi:hypothetical protein
MSLTISQCQAIFALNPSIVTIRGDIAYNNNEIEITYDINAVNAKIAQDKVDALAAEQAQATAKASALAKLAALGLTQDEVKALIS